MEPVNNERDADNTYNTADRPDTRRPDKPAQKRSGTRIEVARKPDVTQSSEYADLSDERREPTRIPQWHIEASEVSVIESIRPAAERNLPDTTRQSNEAALIALNERISRIEGLIAGELAERIQQAVSHLPTKDDMIEAVNEAVASSTAEVVGKAVEPLLEEVALLEARHREEMKKQQTQHESAIQEMVRRFDGLGDEIAKYNALTEEQIAKLQERKTRWWPW